MLNDNWHKRFGRMWILIILIGVGLFIEVECRTCMNERLLGMFEDHDRKFYEKEQEIKMLRISHRVDALMIDYLMRPPEKRNKFNGNFKMDEHIPLIILSAFTNEDIK